MDSRRKMIDCKRIKRGATGHSQEEFETFRRDAEEPIERNYTGENVHLVCAVTRDSLNSSYWMALIVEILGGIKELCVAKFHGPVGRIISELRATR